MTGLQVGDSSGDTETALTCQFASRFRFREGDRLAEVDVMIKSLEEWRRSEESASGRWSVRGWGTFVVAVRLDG